MLDGWASHEPNNGPQVLAKSDLNGTGRAGGDFDSGIAASLPELQGQFGAERSRPFRSGSRLLLEHPLNGQHTVSSNGRTGYSFLSFGSQGPLGGVRQEAHV